MSFVYDICASYIIMNRGSLFCFVCHVEISQTTALHAMLLVSLESSQWVGVHRLGLRPFGGMVWKLLIIESLSQWKLNEIAIENFIRIWVYSRNSTHSETICLWPGLCLRRHWNCFSTLELLLPLYVTFVGSLNACTNRDVLEEGRFAHKQIVETGWDSFTWSFADVLVSSMHHQALQQHLLQMIMNTHLLDVKQLLTFLWTLKSVQWSIYILFHYLMEVASFAVLYLILRASLYNYCKQRICWVSFVFYFVYCFLVLCSLFVFLLWNSLWLVEEVLTSICFDLTFMLLHCISSHSLTCHVYFLGTSQAYSQEYHSCLSDLE
jgi:hypothetical protein